jgi:signal transduction histidine kinase
MLVTRQVAVISRARSALESSRSKSEFLTRVGHELRTPLDAVIGYAELIEEENEDPGTRRDAQRIVSAARHLGTLINDILDQSRVDSGRIKFNLEVLPVAGMIAEVQGLMGPSARANKVSFSAVTEAGAGFVFADHVRLRQCLMNIVGNAIKFSHGREVTLVARREMRGEKAMIIFDVCDTGIGIAKGELENVFRPFGQANTEIAKEFGGTGLGLSISRDLARGMSGDIEVVSEFGKGSTFSLVLPVATAAALRAA